MFMFNTDDDFCMVMPSCKRNDDMRIEFLME